MIYQSVNPFDGFVLKSYQAATDTEVESSLVKADACFDIWRQTTFAQRAAVAEKAADMLRLRTDEFARLITLEMGKRTSEAKAEVLLSAAIIEYYAKNAESFLVSVQLTPKTGEAEVESTPIGVLFGV